MMKRLIDVAMGREKPDLVLKGAKVLNVFSERLEEKDVAICGGYIAGLGVYDGDKTIMPSYLVGVQMALDSIEKAKALDVEYILAPHFGILNAEQSAFYLGNMAKSAKETADEIVEILKNGGGKEEAFAHYEKKFYHGRIKQGYPRGAMELNASIIIALIEREFLTPAE